MTPTDLYLLFTASPNAVLRGEYKLSQALLALFPQMRPELVRQPTRKTGLQLIARRRHASAISLVRKARLPYGSRDENAQ